MLLQDLFYTLYFLRPNFTIIYCYCCRYFATI